jgi:hypothetical protein
MESTHALVLQGRELGSLLRTVLATGSTPRVHSATLLGCSHTDFRLVGAALSAVAMASPPIAKLRCSMLFYATQPQHQLQRLGWLAYTLYYCPRWNQSLLALSLLSSDAVISEQESAHIDDDEMRSIKLLF